MSDNDNWRPLGASPSQQALPAVRELDALLRADPALNALARNHPALDPGHPHALDHMAYADGIARPERMLQLEDEDPFWRTLGGSVDDPFGDGGETFRQREIAARHRRFVEHSTDSPSNDAANKGLDPQKP